MGCGHGPVQARCPWARTLRTAGVGGRDLRRRVPWVARSSPSRPRDPAAAQLLQGALRTLRRHAGDYRVPGEISLYDLIHRTQHRSYHDTVVWQLRDLNVITRDPYFATLANVLDADGR